MFFSDSLTWIRRPRLASLTLTTYVETDHPLVSGQPDRISIVPVAYDGVLVSQIFRCCDVPEPSRAQRRAWQSLGDDRAPCDRARVQSRLSHAHL